MKRLPILLLSALLIVVIALVVILCLSAVQYGENSNTNWPAEKITEKLAKLESHITDYSSTDPNDMVGEKFEYTSKVYFTDDRIPHSGEAGEKKYAGNLEVFNNSREAQIRKEYLEYLYDMYDEYITEEEFGIHIFNQFQEDKDHLLLHGNVLLRLQSGYTPEQVEEMDGKLQNVLKSYRQKDVEVASDDAYKAYIKERYESAVGPMIEQKTLLIESLNNAVVEYVSDLDGLSRAELVSLKIGVKEFNEIPIVREEVSRQLSRIETALQQYEERAA